MSLETKRLWRLNNPDKVKAQQERRRARKAAMSDEDKAAAREKKQATQRKYRESLKADPVARERQNARTRERYRLKRGLPVDAPLFGARKNKYTTEEERRAAKQESKRRSYARKHGLTVEEVAARKAARDAERAVARAEKKQRPADPAKRAQRAAESRAAKERAQRRAAPVARTEKRGPAPVNGNDPPELIELFRKASKGEPPGPYRPGRKGKISVYQFRGGNFRRP